MTKVLIDTNIFLNFFRFKDGRSSMKLLKKLNDLILNQKIKLILPKQILDEFNRNKYTVHNQYVENIKQSWIVNIQIPDSAVASKKKRIRSAQKKLGKLKEEILADYSKIAFGNKNSIDQRLNKLFKEANSLIESDRTVQSAYLRTLRGNPPLKGQNSFGDAIIWEEILNSCSDDNLSIISGDKDFTSDINPGQINEFLQNEWSQKTSKKLIFYNSLGAFINDHTASDKEKVQDATIQEEEILSATPTRSNLYTLIQPTNYYNSLNLANTSTDTVSLGIADPKIFGNGLLSSQSLNLNCIFCGNIIFEGSYLARICEKCLTNRHTAFSWETCKKCYRSFYKSLTDDDICPDCQNIT